MAITLRDAHSGEPVGAGHIARDGSGRRWEVDNWSTGTIKVYARPPGHMPPAPVREFNPSELGLYIGQPRGQPVSAIKWGQTHVEPYAHPATRIEAVRRYNAELDAAERSPTGDDYNALLRILGV